jgi:hypothetical protein
VVIQAPTSNLSLTGGAPTEGGMFFWGWVCHSFARAPVLGIKGGLLQKEGIAGWCRGSFALAFAEHKGRVPEKGSSVENGHLKVAAFLCCL